MTAIIGSFFFGGAINSFAGVQYSLNSFGWLWVIIGCLIVFTILGVYVQKKLGFDVT